MSDIKEIKDEKNITETYEEFVVLINEEYPNPLYFYDEEDEYADRFVKENPGSLILTKGLKGKAVCLDSHSALKYAYENASVLTDFVYATSMLKLAMLETPIDIVLKVKGGD